MALTLLAAITAFLAGYFLGASDRRSASKETSARSIAAETQYPQTQKLRPAAPHYRQKLSEKYPIAENKLDDETRALVISLLRANRPHDAKRVYKTAANVSETEAVERILLM